MIFLPEDEHQSFLQAGILFLLVIACMLIEPKIATLQYPCNISNKKEGGMKMIFCMQLNIKLSYKLIPLILLGIAIPAHITQNNNSTKSVQFLKKG